MQNTLYFIINDITKNNCYKVTTLVSLLIVHNVFLYKL